MSPEPADGPTDVPAAAWPSLRSWFGSPRPGPQVLEHVLRTGLGRIRADRWPDPGFLAVEPPGDIVLLTGTPPATVRVTGLVEAAPEWAPAFGPGTATWPRIIAELPDGVGVPEPPGVRLLGRADAGLLAGLDPDDAWIHTTWGGAAGLADAGVARAVVVDGRAVSVAVPFHMGDRYEDIGVITDAAHRGRGYSTACAAALVADIRARGRRPSWSTSPDNTASLAVAARLGFVHHRDDVLYAVGVPIPT